jgi:hypothetical protein
MLKLVAERRRMPRKPFGQMAAIVVKQVLFAVSALTVAHCAHSRGRLAIYGAHSRGRPFSALVEPFQMMTLADAHTAFG